MTVCLRPGHFPPLVAGPAIRPVGPPPGFSWPVSATPATPPRVKATVVPAPVGLPQRKKLIRVRIPAIRITPPEEDTPLSVAAPVPVVTAVEGKVSGSTPVPTPTVGSNPDSPAASGEVGALDDASGCVPPAAVGLGGLLGGLTSPMKIFSCDVVNKQGVKTTHRVQVFGDVALSAPASLTDVTGDGNLLAAAKDVQVWTGLPEGTIENTCDWRGAQADSSFEVDTPVGSPAPKRLKFDNTSLPESMTTGRRPTKEIISSDNLETSLNVSSNSGGTGLTALTLKPSTLEGTLSAPTLVEGAGRDLSINFGRVLGCFGTFPNFVFITLKE
jgi:hypothetical protein